MTLQEFFTEHPKAALGFSGGVDSSYLLYAGIKAGADIRPYFIKTAFQPEFELEDAKRLCAQLGAELYIIELDALANPDVVKNPANRCYYCKTGLFGTLQQRAKADGYTVLLDGTNASDDAGDRPGMKALTEMSVLSPLRLCGLSKAQIRELSREAGLFTWDKPAYACLATRVPTGEAITEALLARVEGAVQRRLAVRLLSSALICGLGGMAAVRIGANILATWVYNEPELAGMFILSAPLTLLFAVQHAVNALLSGLGEQRQALMPALAGSLLTLALLHRWTALPGARIAGAIRAMQLGQSATLLSTLGLLALALRQSKTPD